MPDPARSFSAPAVRTVSLLQAADLDALSCGGCTVLIESGGKDTPPDGGEQEQAEALRLHALFPPESLTTGILLGLCLTTGSACTHDIPAAIIAGLRHQGLTAASGCTRLHTALHEAIANALIHGNLELASPRRDEPADFCTFGDAIAERLADPTYNRRHLWISLCPPARPGEGARLLVRNEGNGFNPASLPPQERRRPERAHGGWALILAGCERATFSPDGKTLTLTLPPESGASDPA